MSLLAPYILHGTGGGGGGGASGNYTFTVPQYAKQGPGPGGEPLGDPATATFGSAITAGNLLIAMVAERSGGDPANHTISDNNGKTWNRITDVNFDNSVGGSEGDTRTTFSVWWRKVDATGETDTTPTVTADDGTANGKRLQVMEVQPSAAYDWTYAAASVAGSGLSDIDNLSSGAASPTGDDICVIGIWSSRVSADVMSVFGMDEYSITGYTDANTNTIACLTGVLGTSQADSSTYSSTVDVGGTGSGNEGICATICFKDGA